MRSLACGGLAAVLFAFIAPASAQVLTPELIAKAASCDKRAADRVSQLLVRNVPRWLTVYEPANQYTPEFFESKKKIEAYGRTFDAFTWFYNGTDTEVRLVINSADLESFAAGQKMKPVEDLGMRWYYRPAPQNRMHSAFEPVERQGKMDGKATVGCVSDIVSEKEYVDGIMQVKQFLQAAAALSREADNQKKLEADATAANLPLPTNLSAQEAAAETKEVRRLARLAPQCKWSSPEEAESVAGYFAPILIGVGTRSFEACLEFLEVDLKAALGEGFGDALAVDRALCGDAAQKAKWNDMRLRYTYDRAEATAGTSTFSEKVCAFQPSERSGKLEAAELSRFLVKASSLCNLQAVERALSLGADVNAPVPQPAGNRPLDTDYPLGAALRQTDMLSPKSCLDTVSLLLQKGADAKQRFGHATALTLAVQAPASVVEELIAAGADPNAAVTGEAPKSIKLEEYNLYSPVSVGKTPLMHLVEYRAYAIENPNANQAKSQETRRVLDIYLKKSNLNLQDWLGRTALMFAVEKGSNKTARLLLAAGADAKIKDNFGRDALAYARLAKNAEMQKVLAK